MHTLVNSINFWLKRNERSFTYHMQRELICFTLLFTTFYSYFITFFYYFLLIFSINVGKILGKIPFLWIMLPAFMIFIGTLSI